MFRFFANWVCIIFFGLSVTTSSQATNIGDDGLHKQPWLTETFNNIAEDISDAKGEGKRLLILVEQRGCIYCKKLHETVLSNKEVAAYIKKHYTVVQYNMFGDKEVTDLDGEVLSEKTAARKWRLNYTPTMLFLPDTAPKAAASASEMAVSTLPGAFGKLTVLHMLQWVIEKGYQTDEPFQKYHARKLSAKKSEVAK